MIIIEHWVRQAPDPTAPRPNDRHLDPDLIRATLNADDPLRTELLDRRRRADEAFGPLTA